MLSDILEGFTEGFDTADYQDAKAVLATLPLSAFMIAYTALGLWLLSAPKGA